MSAPDSPLVQEMRRLRALPGNSPEANSLIDQAIAAQLAGEANINSPTGPSPKGPVPPEHKKQACDRDVGIRQIFREDLQ